MVAAGFSIAGLLYFGPSIPSAYASASSSTFSTISAISLIGYAIPNASGLGAALVPFILPILVTGLLLLLTHYMSLGGEINSLVLKVGMFVGCLLGMLSLTASAATLIPFAFPVVSGIYVVTYVWKKV